MATTSHPAPHSRESWLLRRATDALYLVGAAALTLPLILPFG